ncbi:hypothetical protein [Nocardiopsis halophila]|uniref:hypothetical protein n=1 Tax=Nocardiopsis halophila TaxID=141692 RepID=UPI00035F4F2D|nr:hypothetical protein [Nocardiopsis halophila]
MGWSSVTAALEGAVLVSPVWVLLFAVLVRIGRRRRADRLPAVLDSAADVLCAVSVLGIVSLTLLNPGTVGGLVLVPFSVTASSGPGVTGLCQNGGNAALFLPLGAFLPPALGRRPADGAGGRSGPRALSGGPLRLTTAL